MAKILFIDDDESLGILYSEILKENGHDTTICMSGTAGLEKFSCEKVDIVILDLSLPDIRGVEVLQSLRKQRADIPVLVFSAYANQPEELEVLIKDDANTYYLVKTTQFGQLSEKIEDIMTG